MTTVLSFDLGASNGRLVSQLFDGAKLKLTEIHRFTNKPVEENGHFYWDFNFFMREIVNGIRFAQHQVPGTISGIGIDTWGVDFGIVDSKGKLISKPFSYRDTYTLPYMEAALEEMGGINLFKMTGNEISSINTLFQLLAIENQYPDLLEKAAHILMMPNLIQFALTGVAQNEFTIASTSQLVQANQPNWHEDLLQKFFRKPLPLAEIYQPHRIMGSISKQIQQKEQLADISIIMTPGHDTACALSALPIQNPNSCFMSIGTWTLVGKEIDQPIITEEAFTEGFTNEGTSEGKYRFQRNGMGFWIMQGLRSEWNKSGRGLTYEEENELIEHASVNEIFIDPDDALFFNPASMEKAIHDYCQKTNQVTPLSQQDTIICVIESMALNYAYTVRRTEEITNTYADVIYVGGGGIQNRYLCQCIANATKKEVIAGPIEASAIGNGLSQLRALGEIKSVEEGRSVVAESFAMLTYHPRDPDHWKSAQDQFLANFTI